MATKEGVERLLAELASDAEVAAGELPPIRPELATRLAEIVKDHQPKIVGPITFCDQLEEDLRNDLIDVTPELLTNEDLQSIRNRAEVRILANRILKEFDENGSEGEEN